MIARFTAERIRGAGKSSIFNLGEDFSLTHGGEKLNEIEKFEDPNSEDDEDEEKLLSKDFVNEAHFGGFMTKADDDFKSGKGNNRKDFIENLIKESKKKKAEKRKADEEAEEKTQELDSNWKNLLRNIQEKGGLLGKGDDEEQRNYDPYDMLVKSLSFQKKEARAGERLKTEEEKFKEERDRLQRLEEDRLRRMRGVSEEEALVTRQTVEDIATDSKNVNKKLTWQERRKIEKAEKRRAKTDDKEEEGDENDEDEDEENEEENESDEEGEDDVSDGENEDDEDDNSDLEESDDENQEDDAIPETNEKDSFDEKMIEMMDTAAKEIPYLITVHDSYESFSALVWGRSQEELQTILERILSTNHPQVSEDKLLLVPHYKHVLQFLQDLCHDYKSDLVSTVVNHVARMTTLFQQPAASCCLEICEEKFQEFHQSSRPCYPSLDTVVFLHLLHLIFPTSDYRHPVTTPAITFISSIMSTARPSDRASLASCINLASVALEYVSLSKRFIPELVNTLHGLVYLASSNNPSRPPPPCKGGNYLTLTSDMKTTSVNNISFSEVNSVKEVDEEFKVSSLAAVLKITIKLLKLYRDIPSSFEIFEQMKKSLDVVDKDKYPSSVVQMIDQVISTIGGLRRRKVGVLKPSKKKPLLRMLEPEIEDNFDPFVKKRVGKKDLLEEQKMRHKLKQEKKGARKEIRQDSAFLATQKFREQRQKDADRQAKVKDLFASLANQEGDYNKLLKDKRKAKKKL